MKYIIKTNGGERVVEERNEILQYVLVCDKPKKKWSVHSGPYYRVETLKFTGNNLWLFFSEQSKWCLINNIETIQTESDIMFKNLTTDEIEEYKSWARNNHIPGDTINRIWHPVVQKECEQINMEKENGVN